MNDVGRWDILTSHGRQDSLEVIARHPMGSSVTPANARRPRMADVTAIEWTDATSNPVTG